MTEKHYLRIKAATPYYNFVRKIAFPSLKQTVLAILLVDLVGSILVFYLYSGSLLGLPAALMMGLLVLAFPSIISDPVVDRFALRRDPVFNLRRCFALSLFSSVVLIGGLVIGALAGKMFHTFAFPGDAFYLGVFIAAPFRCVTIFSMSSADRISKAFSAVFEPFLSLISVSLLFQLSVEKSSLVFVASFLISFAYAALILTYLEKMGMGRIGISPTQLFRGFLSSMLDKKSELIERQLEKISSEQDLNTTVLEFRQKGSQSNSAILVVSNFHPGPFLNVGSSILPQVMQDSLAEETNAIIGVPHGISGHEMNLVSQVENQKVVEEVLKATGLQDFQSIATKLVRVSSGNATASCQVFGECSLVTITLSPNDMEDIPLDVGSQLTFTGIKFFRETALIDAHNSIKNAKILDDKDESDIVDSTEKALEKASREPRSPFSFGVARVSLDEFTCEQGIGPGGLVALVVKVAEQISAYLIVDGNNMKSGLRERILQAMVEMGIQCGEVMTTDTHVVNGITSARLGYHPVGEAIDDDAFMKKIKSVISEAKKNLCEGEISSNSIKTRVKTLGSALFKNMAELIHYISRLVVFSIIPTIIISVIVFVLIMIRS